MTQHLYECSWCHKYGVAHYVLQDGVLVLICTGCFVMWKKSGDKES